MGISGLLPLLKSIQKPTHLKHYAGEIIGIDAYVWLHRGAYGCAWNLATSRNTTRFVQYTMRKIRQLRKFGIVPFVVLDGGYLPAKAGIEVQRQQKRENHRMEGIKEMWNGNRSNALKHFQNSLDVTPEMAYQLIKALKKHGIQYIVAPYEADAQLAYLERQGIISAIITEDSDLLVFGCKKVLFKLDDNGACFEVSQADFARNKDLALHGWTEKEFRQMAILSGCDYLPKIPYFGLKTAHRLLRKYKTAERVIKSIRMDGKFQIPSDYEHQFRLAEMTFEHQLVYDPKSKNLVHLTPISDANAELAADYIGHELSPNVAFAIAVGDLNPITKDPIIDMAPSDDNQMIVVNNNPLKDNGLCPSENISSPHRNLLSYFRTPTQPLKPLENNRSLSENIRPQHLNLLSSCQTRTEMSTPVVDNVQRSSEDIPPPHLNLLSYFQIPPQTSRPLPPPSSKQVWADSLSKHDSRIRRTPLASGREKVNRGTRSSPFFATLPGIPTVKGICSEEIPTDVSINFIVDNENNVDKVAAGWKRKFSASMTSIELKKAHLDLDPTYSCGG